MAFNGFERLMAWRYLRARRKEGFVSVITGFSLLGICLGVATLIIVMSVMNGFRQELLSRILGINGHISIYATQGKSLSNFDAMAAQLKQIPEVEQVIPTIQGQVLLTHQGRSQGGLIRGIRVEDFEKQPLLMEHLYGNGLETLRNDGVIVGSTLASRGLNADVGDSITVVSPKGTVTAFGTMPRVRAYRIHATFNVGMFEYDSSFVFMPLPVAQAYFSLPRSVTHMEVFLVPGSLDKTAEVQKKIQDLLTDNYNVVSWEDQHASFFNAIQVERNVMFLILTLIILVAAFNIISGLVMLVKDKGRDIAVLRTMGATKHSIMRIFFMTGATIGLAGTTLGTGLGLIFCHYIENIRKGLEHVMGTNLFSAEIYFLSKLPAVVDPSEVISVTLMALGLSFAATIYPAWRASKLDPVEALRYE